jgi:hypothetical protein
MKKATKKAAGKRTTTKDLATRKGRDVRGGAEPVNTFKTRLPRPAEPVIG